MKEKLPALYLNKIGNLSEIADFYNHIEKEALRRMRPGSKQAVIEAIVDAMAVRRNRLGLIRWGMRYDSE